MSDSSQSPSSAGKSGFTVIFQPSGRRGLVAPDLDLLSVARGFGVEIESACGGKGVCKKCRVRIESDRDCVSPPTEAEMKAFNAEALAAGMRLACQTRVVGDVRVFVPEESRRVGQVVRKEAGKRTVPLDPAVRSHHTTLVAPTLHDATADADRLLAALEEQHGLKDLEFDFEVLQAFPGIARKAQWDLAVIVWHGRKIVDVRPATDPGRVLGLAVDVGTTTIAAYLTDLEDGEVLVTESAMNPQVAFGDDVIARLHHAMHDPEGPAVLQRTVISEINNLARKAAEHTGTRLEDILDVVMVGNTAMHHLFLGLDARALGSAPFAPAIQRAVDTTASALGLEFHRGCRIHVLPVEAGFVGADNVAVMITEEPYEQDEVLLLIDIGTNGELVLGDRRRMLSAACATGPALEGAHLEFGMRAAPGAIERIRIEPETLDVRFKIIGLEGWHTDYPADQVGARGICGSGIVEAAAEMMMAGVIMSNGNFNQELRHDRIVLENGRPRKFVIAWAEETAVGHDITVSLKDIRAIQLAKGALRAGAEILLRRYGVRSPDRVILAGAFGTYIDKGHALAIGMLPDCPLERVTSVGNAAGDGARFALLSVNKREEAARAASKVEYVELATDPDFQTEYVKGMQFGPISDGS
ncbi:MAG: DUF4445 domain-containing protein [Actinobacteria bacterium]|nr:DUF4445 domain-containing protein [Actinomycetota bacterium]